MEINPIQESITFIFYKMKEKKKNLILTPNFGKSECFSRISAHQFTFTYNSIYYSLNDLHLPSYNNLW